MEGESGGTREEKVVPAVCLSATWSPSWHPLLQSLWCWFTMVGKVGFFEDNVLSCCRCINFISYWCAWDWISAVNPYDNPEAAGGSSGSTTGSGRLSNSLETTQQVAEVGF